MIKVYIASPYSKGDHATNVSRSIDCADKLIDEGFAPFNPLLYHFHHQLHPRPYEDWMMLDIEWLWFCDALLRLHGESPGADREVEYARDNSIPVFYSTEQIKEYYNDLA